MLVLMLTTFGEKVKAMYNPNLFSNTGPSLSEHELRKTVDTLKEHKRQIVSPSHWNAFHAYIAADAYTKANKQDLLKYIARHDNIYSKEERRFFGLISTGKIDENSKPLEIAEIKALYTAYDEWAQDTGKPKLEIEKKGDGNTPSVLDKGLGQKDELRNELKTKSNEYDQIERELFKLRGQTLFAGGLGILLIAGFFACKEGFAYWKETAMNPPFVDDTNDKNALNEFYDWFTGKSKKGFKPTDKELQFNDDKIEEMQLLKKGYKDAIKNNTPTDHYLFFGPHGTGKTHFARKLATKISSTYYIISASAFTEQKGSENFRQLMSYIRSSNSRPVIVIDEADNLLKHSTELSSLERTVFNQILEATGDTDNHVATFIFCTNLPDSIDERMKSRLTMVEFTNPNHKTREKIINNNLEYYFEKAVGGHATINYTRITPEAIAEVAKITEGWSGRAIDKGFEKLRSYMWVKKNFDCTPELFINFFKEIMLKDKVIRDAGTKLQNFYKEKARASHK